MQLWKKGRSRLSRQPSHRLSDRCTATAARTTARAADGCDGGDCDGGGDEGDEGSDRDGEAAVGD